MTAVATDPWLNRAGQAMAANAVLHLIVPLFVGFGTVGIGMAFIGLVYGGIAWLLLKGTRWAAYLAFLTGLFGTNAALIALSATSVPDSLLWLIVLADLAVVVFTFVSIWRR